MCKKWSINPGLPEKQKGKFSFLAGGRGFVVKTFSGLEGAGTLGSGFTKKNPDFTARSTFKNQ
ncbi:hypothetical protein [Bdellovibrio sp.]|uniref:hypothetical protein n=1 Tax=Bdellovibrio sp. TaxID=28201 RepID=UPI0032219F46